MTVDDDWETGSDVSSHAGRGSGVFLAPQPVHAGPSSGVTPALGLGVSADLGSGVTPALGLLTGAQANVTVFPTLVAEWLKQIGHASDSWIHIGKLWMRIHVKPRQCLFTPTGTTGGP